MRLFVIKFAALASHEAGLLDIVNNWLLEVLFQAMFENTAFSHAVYNSNCGYFSPLS